MTSNNTESVVEPCPTPWCGYAEGSSIWQGPDDLFQVICDECQVEGPSRPTEAEAIAAWNTRQSASTIEELLKALEDVTQFFARDDENSIGRFDRLAEQFYREVGIMAPGKSVSMASNDTTTDEERREKYDAWVASKVTRARSLLSCQGEGK